MKRVKKKIPLPRSECWANFRFSVVSPLLSSPPKNGELTSRIKALVKLDWVHPMSSELIQLKFPTVERWYYLAKNAEPNPIEALKTPKRKDAGQFRKLTKAVKTALQEQYNDYTNWSIQLHYDNLVALFESNKKSDEQIPSYSTIRRFMNNEGLVKQVRRYGPNSPSAKKAEKRIEDREIRGYEVEYVNELWHLDFHHGSLKILTKKGEWVTPLLLCIIDDHSRFVCHAQWYLSESSENLVHGYSQAVEKRGTLARRTMTDNGAAMMSGEFSGGLPRLSTEHETTLPYSPYQNAKQENFWTKIEGRLLPMLEKVKELTLKQLNELTQAWLEMEYHRTFHREIKDTPLHRYMNNKNVGRPAPGYNQLKKAFQIQVTRVQRRSDNTCSVDSIRFEVPSAYHKLKNLTLSYASWDLSVIYLVDPSNPKMEVPLRPQNKVANANKARKTRNKIISKPKKVSTTSKLAPLMETYLEEYAASGLPKNFLPKDEQEELNCE